jgi:hypothetical protein
MAHRRHRGYAWLVVAMAAMAGLVGLNHQAETSAHSAIHGVDAYAIGLSGVSVLGRPIANQTLGTVGPPPPGGGTLTTGPAILVLPDGMGTLRVAGAMVSRASGTGRTLDTVNGLDLFPQLTANQIRTLCLPFLGCVPRLVATGGGPVELLDITFARSTASASSTNPAAHAENTQVGAISLLGGAVEVPLSATPNTTVNLGLLSITLNRRSYDPSTNTASAQAVVLHFPPDGQLAPAITGTITIASSTVSAS